MSEKCGCYCIQDVTDSFKPNPYKIVFCPLHAHAEELREALQGIIDIGKRDMTNPKYDGYFIAANKALAKSTPRGSR